MSAFQQCPSGVGKNVDCKYAAVNKPETSIASKSPANRYHRPCRFPIIQARAPNKNTHIAAIID